MTKKQEKILDAIATIENLKSRICDGHRVWAGETKQSFNNCINRLSEYYEFESRTCESCKHLNGAYCFALHGANIEEITDSKDFSCNKWEAK